MRSCPCSSLIIGFSTSRVYSSYIYLYYIEISETLLYEDVCDDFVEDYDRENPITRNEAVEKFLQRIALKNNAAGKSTK
jgi:hypothetical protein